MNEDLWTTVDDYLVGMLLAPDPVLDAALADSAAGGLPHINVAPNQGKMLELLARSRGARRILEIGTLGGYSTISLARALGDGGELTTLELEPAHAKVARANLDRAGFENVVHVLVGPAASTLRDMIETETEPFDFIFIDADKEGYSEYFELCLQLSAPGTLIVADNVVRDGAVIDPANPDTRVEGVRAFLERVAREARVEATAVQTVGSKGYDGFALIYVTS